MPYTLLPPGHRAVFLGSAGSVHGLSDFTPLEEAVPEGCRVLVRLDFEDYPSLEVCSQLNQELLARGIPPWPEHQDIVFVHPSEHAIYIVWWKGMVWWGWILALLASFVLPPLLMSAIWAILPEEVQQMLEMLMWLGIMVVMMFAFSAITKAMKPKEKTRQVEAKAKPKPKAEETIARLAGEVETAERVLGVKK